jgi:cation diffusion facilitator CzcD-associated flavoprotein CzcO
VADWLEYYASSLDLDVWTSSKVRSATWNDSKKKWRVEIITTDNQDEPRFFNVKHLVFATGFAGNIAKVPEIPKKV